MQNDRRKHPRFFKVLYISKILAGFSFSSGSETTKRFADNNKRHSLTGFLIRTPVHFIQYLEGPRKSVVTLLRLIEQDPRHEKMTIVASTVGFSRHFADWDMGFLSSDLMGSVRLEEAFGRSNLKSDTLIERAIAFRERALHSSDVAHID